MTKKRKLNSKNPKYQDQIQNKDKIIEKRILMCTAPNNVKVYGIWYKN